jgi:hypothetical protein
MDLVIRIPERIRTPRGVFRIVDEHNATFNEKGLVGFGKFGAPLSANMVEQIKAAISEKGSQLYVVTKRSGEFHAATASIKSVLRDCKKDQPGDIFPPYYNELFDAPSSCVILESQLRSADIGSLQLVSNRRPLQSVINECRTSVMLVKSVFA